MTVTGKELDWLNQPGIADRDQALQSLFNQITGESERNKKGNSTAMRSPSADQRTQILQDAARGQDKEKFRRLWSGDWTGYASQSEGDLALCRVLALHCGYKKAWVDALFRQSALFREKWDTTKSTDGRTYGDLTIAKACTRVRLELKKRWAVRAASDTTPVEGSQQEYLVEGILPVRALGVVAGNSGLGKSPLLYQLGICVASGTPFLGCEVKRGRVLYLDYENGTAAANEIVQNMAGYLGLQEPPASFLSWTLDTATTRWKPGSGPFEMIRDFRPDLVIIDSLSAFEPRMEGTNFKANLVLGKLRSASRESGCAILMAHHLVKPSRKGIELEPLETCNLTMWFAQARGASALINSSDVRLGVARPGRRPAFKTKGAEETALVARGFARITGEIPLMFLARVFNAKGEAVGYRALIGAELLFNAKQEAAYGKLPLVFRFKDARMIYGKGNEATSLFLKKCISQKILRKTADGYQKIDSAGTP